jgi:hypothetical protein
MERGKKETFQEGEGQNQRKGSNVASKDDQKEREVQSLL